MATPGSTTPATCALTCELCDKSCDATWSFKGHLFCFGCYKQENKKEQTRLQTESPSALVPPTVPLPPPLAGLPTPPLPPLARPELLAPLAMTAPPAPPATAAPAPGGTSSVWTSVTLRVPPPPFSWEAHSQMAPAVVDQIQRNPNLVNPTLHTRNFPGGNDQSIGLHHPQSGPPELTSNFIPRDKPTKIPSSGTGPPRYRYRSNDCEL